MIIAGIAIFCFAGGLINFNLKDKPATTTVDLIIGNENQVIWLQDNGSGFKRIASVPVNGITNKTGLMPNYFWCQTKITFK